MNNTNYTNNVTLTDQAEDFYSNRLDVLQANQQLSGVGGIEYNGYVYEPIEIRAMVDDSPSFSIPYSTLEEALTASDRMHDVGYASFLEMYADGVLVMFSDTLWGYTPPTSKDMSTAGIEIKDINDLFF